MVLAILCGVLAGVQPIVAPLAADAGAVTGTVTGQVYSDANQSGTKNVGETGYSSVSVRAFDSLGAVVGTATTNGSGAYTLAVAAAETTALRIEFTSLPAGVGDSIVNGGTDTQFVTLVAGTATADYAATNPSDYAATQPTLASPATTTMATFAYDVNDDTRLFTWPYNTPATTATTMPAIGAVYGVAYHADSDSLFAAAYRKQSTTFGPNGPGAIYRVKNASTATPTVDATWDLDLDDPAYFGAGWSTPADPIGPIRTTSFGDMDLAPDNQTLLAVALGTRELLAIPITATTPPPVDAIGRFAVPSLCNDADENRPSAVAVNGTKVYVAGVCSGENDGTWSLWVQEFVAGATPTAAATWRTVMAPTASPVFDQPANHPASVAWVADRTARDQRSVADFILDEFGGMMLTLRDRYSDTVEPIPAFGAFNYGHGSLLRACSSDGGSTFALESGGTCAGAGFGNNYGYYFSWSGGLDPMEDALPDGGIAYAPGLPRAVVGTPDPGGAGNSARANTGGVAYVRPNLPAVTPFDTVGNGGIPWNKLTGPGAWSFNKNAPIADLEALVNLGSNPPQEIGGRLWHDADGDGVQDAGEAALSGVVVSLYDAGDLTTPIATVTTATDGSYSFNWKYGIDAPGRTFNVREIVPGATLVVGVPTTTPIGGSPVGLTSADTPAGGTRLDSDANAATGRTPSITIGARGVNDHTWDMGYGAPPPALPYDLALTKALASGQVSPVKPGDNVTFTITVVNQGQADAANVQISDVIPTGWTLNDVDWTASGSTAVHTVAALAAGATTTVDITLTVGAVSPLPTTGTPYAATGSLSGTVYRDFNASGTRAVATEPGQAGINVTATCVSDPGVDGTAGTADDLYGAAASAITGVDGSYTVSNLPTGPCRVEFGIPANMPFLFAGAAGRTLVQFVDVTGGSATADAGVNNPSDYTNASSTPDIAAQTWWNSSGDPSNAAPATDSLFRVPYGISGWTQGTAGGRPGEVGGPDTMLTSFDKLGVLWGMAYQRSTGSLFMSSVVRRGGQLKAGPDAIFKVDAATGTTTQLTTTIDVDGGVVPANAARDTRDAAVYQLAGTVGWGDLDILEDDTTLVATNLKDKTVEFIDTTSGAVARSPKTIPNPGCVNGSARPWALKVKDGLLYVGVICDGASGTDADLSAHVYALNTTTIGLRLPGGTGAVTLAAGAWSADLLGSMPLAYARGCASGNATDCGGFHPWVSNPANWATDLTFNSFGGGRSTPLLADIEFDNDGSLILGFMDRTGLQGTAWSPGPAVPAGTNVDGTFATYSRGEIRRLSPPAASGGTYVQEVGGVVARGPALGGGTLTGNSAPGTPAIAGAGEFYYDNFYADLTTFPSHGEVGLGGLAMVPGATNLVSASYNPNNAIDNSFPNWIFNADGLRWLSNTDGGLQRGFTLQDWADQQSGPPVIAGFGKAGSLSDVELIADLAPVEIGNRVWNDANGNGVQDPGEPGLSGVTVGLSDGAGGHTASATTAADGTYYFSSAASGAGGTGAVYGLTWLTEGTAVTLTFPTSTTAGNLTSTDGTSGAGSDVRDSDAAQGTGTLAYTVGAAGHNDHTLDAGYTTSQRRYAGHVCNTAEISGDDGSDVDSSPDGTDGNSNGEGPGVDDATTDPTDEDDHDAACIEVVVGYDLALRKTVASFDGKTATFTIEVFNQGSAAVDAIDVADYIDTSVWQNFVAGANPAGTTGVSTGAAFGAGTYASPAVQPTYTWDATDPTKPVATLSGALARGESVTIPITLTLKTGLAPLPTQAINRAEISEMRVGGAPVTDIDSTPNNVSTDDKGGNLGSPADNAIDGDGTGAVDGTVPATDEDDADPAAVPLYDLAIGKVLSVGQPSILSAPPMPPLVKYDIRVSNQGTTTAYNVVVTDTPPAVMTYVAGSATGSGVTVSGANTFLVPGPIVGGGTATFTVTYQLNDLSGSVFTNVAEISAWDNDADGTNPPPPFVVDIDSTPDTIATNDAGGAPGTGSDNSTAGNGSGLPGDTSPATDEDDADPSQVTLPYDLALRKRIDTTQAAIADGVQDGEKVVFNIEIFNQARDVNGVTIADYIQPGWKYFATDNATCATTAGSYGFLTTLPTCAKSGSDLVPGGTATISLTGSIPGGRSVVVPVVLTADFASRTVGVPVENRSEISAFDDDGNPGTPFAGVDRDSTPDSIDAPAGTPGGDALVDDIIDQTPSSNPPDEDDHDVALLDWWDLSLVKTSTQYLLDAGVAPITASFTIDVKNQGPTDAFDVVVHDTAPAGTTITAVTPPVGVACGATGGTTIDCTIARLNSGQTKSYRITVTITDLSKVVYENNAEISSFKGDLDLGPGPQRVVVADVDSVPDTNLANDAHFVNPTDPFGYPRNGSNDLDWAVGVANVNVPNPADEDDRDIQAVIVPLAVGDYVWFDLDRDGRQETGELPVPGVVVHLLMEDPAAPGTFIDAKDATGAPVPDDTTDVNGWYAFDKLLAGTYKVRFSLPPALVSYQWTRLDQPGGDAADSDATFVAPTDDVAETAAFRLDTNEPNVAPVTSFDRVDLGSITAANIDRTRDAGLWMPVAVGDIVWFDNDYDGVQDGVGAGEGPVSGVTVTLQTALGGPVTDANGNPVAPVVTLADGAYIFDNLIPGSYRIVFSTLPAGYIPTKPAQGGDPALDSNTDQASLTTPNFTLAPTGSNMQPNVGPGRIAPVIDPSIDMGIFKPLSVGDLVWIDANHDGVYDPATESGIDNVTVELLDDSGNPAVDILGNPVPSTTTAGGGRYSFANLAPGDYQVRFTLPAGYEWTSPLQGADSALNSDAAFTTTTDATATSATFTLSPTPVVDSDPAGLVLTDPSLDAGVWFPYAIGDIVWYDLDRNGRQDAGELPVDGVKVELTDAAGNPVNDADGNPVGPLTTGPDGLYLFDNLLPGTYRVRFTHNQTGYRWTVPNNQPTVLDDADSDATPAVANTDASASTGGIVLGSTQPNVRATTAADDTTYGVAVRAAYIDPTNDAGIWIPVAVGDIVWFDVDRDGTQDGAGAGEGPVQGVTVVLLTAVGGPVTDADGNPVAPFVTLADGKYVFDDLLPGDYTIQFSTLPAGWSATTPLAGSDRAIDSNPDPVTLTTPTFTLSAAGPNMVPNLDPAVDAAVIDPTIDLGLVPAYSLGNRLWIDMGPGAATNNGVFDVGELPVDGALVELLDSAGASIDPDGAGPLTATTTTTDPAGYYRFDGLAPGDYRVRILPVNFAAGGLLESHLSSTGASPDFTATGNNADHGTDDPDPATNGITSAVVTLGPGAAGPTGEVDAGATGAAANGAAGDAFDNLTVDFGFIQPFDLMLSKTRTSASPVAAGTTVTWDLVVTNNGPGLAVTGFTITDRLPAGLTFTATPGSGTGWSCLAPTGNDIACTYSGAGLAAGESSTTLTLSSTVDAPSTGATLRNVAVVEPSLNQKTPETIPVGSTPDKFENGDNVPTPGSPSNNDDSDIVDVTPSFSLGNRLWIDMGPGAATNNGVFDSGELPVNGATIELLDGAGNPIDPDGAGPLTSTTTLTDTAGYYRFDGLAAGDYRVRVTAANFAAGPLAGFLSSTNASSDFTAAGNNADHGVDDADPATNGIASATVTLGAPAPTGDVDSGATGAGTNGPTGDVLDNLTVDFGFIQPFDLTLAKTRTSAATATPGSTVTWALTVTNNGPGVARRGFTVTDRLPAGLTFTASPGSGTGWSCAPPSGADIVCTWTGGDLNAGDSTSSLTLSSTVDALAIGGVARNVAVVEPVPTQPTPETIPVGSTPDKFENGDNVPTPTDPSNNDDADVVTIVQVFSLGNRLWIDLGAGAAANNGVFDTGELPVNGATVELLDGTGASIDPDGAGPLTALTTTTDPAGYYRFDGLPAGDYRVHVVAANFAPGAALAGYLSSTGASTDVTVAGNNADHGVDDPTPATNGITSGTVTVGTADPTGDVDSGAAGAGANGPTGDGRDNLTVDFGFIQPFDLTLAKTRTSASPVVAGATVTWDLVVTNNGPGVARSGFTVTDRLPAGLSYGVTPGAGTGWTCAAPSGTDLTCTWGGADLAAGQAAGALTITSTVDSPSAGATLRNVAVVEPSPTQPTPETIPPGSTPDMFENGDNTPTPGSPSNNDDSEIVDVSPSFSLGNRLWIDMGVGAAMNNGRFDAGELAVDGATIELLDGAGNPFDPDGAGPLAALTTTTDPSGYYRFDGLPAGDYRVRIAAADFATGGVLEGYLSSTGSSTDFTTAGNNADHGADVATPATTGITSATVTLGSPAPAGDVDAGATGAGANGPTGDVLDNLTVDFGLIQPFDLTLTKTRTSAATAAPGGTVTWDLVVTNDGPGVALSGLTVTDRLPAGLAYSATPASGTGWTCAAPTGLDVTCTWTGAALAAGDSTGPLTVSSIVVVPATGGTLRNVAVVEPVPTQPTPEVIPPGSTPDKFENGNNTPTPGNPSNNDDSDIVDVVTYSLGNRLWKDTGPGAQLNNGRYDTGELPVVGATVELLTAAGGPVDPDGAGPLTTTTTTTDTAGYYRFDGLAAGTYTVRVAASNFAPGAVLATYLSSTGASSDYTAAGNHRDHGVDAAAPGAAGIVSGPVTLGTSDPTGEVEAAATGAGANGPSGDARDNLTVDFGFVQPFDLTLTKTRTSAATATAGSTVTWDLVVTNNGPGAALSGLTITDRLPVGLSYAATPGAGTNWTCAAPSGTDVTCTWNGPDLAAGATTSTLTITSTVDTPAAGGLLRNRAVVEPVPTQTTPETIPPGSTPDKFENGDNTPTPGNPSNNDDSDTVTVPGSVYDLALIKTADVTAAPVGGVITWTVHVANQGTLDSGAFTVVDEIPAGLTLVAGSATTSAAAPAITADVSVPGRITWAFDNLVIGASFDLTFQTTVTDRTLAPYRNWVEIGTDSGNDADSTPNGEEPGGSVGKDTGADPATGTQPNDAVLNHDDPLFDNDTETPKASPDSDDHDYADVGVVVYDLALAKVTSAAAVVPGADVTYTLRVVNQGNVASGAFTVTDRLATGTSFISADHGGTETAGVVTWTIPDLAAGATVDLGLVVNVDSIETLPLRNWAEISADSAAALGTADIDSTPDANTGADQTLPNDATAPGGGYVGITDLTAITPAGGQPSGDEDDNDDAVVTGNVDYDLALIKTATPAAAAPGGIVTWTITVKNQGNVPSHDFQVTDTIPGGMAFNGDCTPACVGTGPLTWTITDLAPGATMTLTFTTTVSDITAKPFRNWAEVSADSSADYGTTDEDSTPDTDTGSDPGGGPGTDPAGDLVVDHNDINVDSPVGDEDDNDFAEVSGDATYDLALVKAAYDATGTNPITAPIDLGDTITWKIRVRNQGNVPAGAFTITDTVPTGLALVAGSIDNGGSVAGGVVTWNVTDLAVGGELTVSFRTTIADPSKAPFRNWAEISADSAQALYGIDDKDSTPDSDTGANATPPNDAYQPMPNLTDVSIDQAPGDEDDNDDATVALDIRYDLALAKVTSTPTVGPDDQITWTIRVVNQGNVASGVFDVTDTLATGLDFVSADHSGGFSFGVVTWPDLPSLLPGEHVDLTLTTSIADVTRRPFRNWAEISADSATALYGPAVTDADSTPDTDTGADGTLPNDAGATGGGYVAIDDLAVIGSDGAPAGDEDDNDDAAVDVAVRYDLALVKVADATRVAPGGAVTFTVTVKNQGNVPSGAYTVTDTLPAGMTFESASAGGTAAGQIVTWAMPSLAPGATEQVSVTAKVTDPTQRSFRNWAEISSDSSSIYGVTDIDSTPDANTGGDTGPGVGTPANDPTIDQMTIVDTGVTGDEDDNDPADVDVDVVYDLALVKVTSTTPDPAAPLAPVTFTLRVANQGNVPTRGFVVSDTLPTGMAFASGSDGATAAGQVVTWTIADLAVGQTKDLTVTASITSATHRSYRNWAEVSADSAGDYGVTDKDSTPDATTGSDSNLPNDAYQPITRLEDASIDRITGDEDDNDDAAYDLPVVYDLALAKRLQANQALPIPEGENVSFEILVRNQGNVASGVIKVLDRIPDGLSFVSATPGAVVDGQQAVWDIDNVDPGQTVVLTLVVKVLDRNKAPFTNWAEIAADGSSLYGVTDKDSTPDTNVGSNGTRPNDRVVDLDIPDADTVPGDEDDNDPASLTADQVTAGVIVPGSTTTTIKSGGTIPKTGASIGRSVGLGVVFLGLGLAAVALGRRRRRPAHR